VRPEAAGEAPVVLVTGATGGIGSAVVRAYAARGARLVLLARSARALDRLAAAVADPAGGVPEPLVMVADVADAGAVEKAVEKAVERFGRLDVVVHAAAVIAYGRLTEIPPEVWDRVVAVGIAGASNVARAALAVLERQGQDGGRGGHLVVVGSILGRVTAPYIGSYVTGKFAVRGLVRVLQQEARQTPGVHVALVEPGSVDTPVYVLAGNYTGRVGRPPPPVARPRVVADAVLAVVDGRRRMASVGLANPLMRLGFSATPWLYDRLVGPLMRVAGLSRRWTPDQPGNVFDASEDTGPRSRQ
jgi:NAD(P)-dependent dehydrogenase (short-subunit alcohol dehydrogenase family)